MKPTRFFFSLNLIGCLLIAGSAFAQKTAAARESPRQAVQQRRPNIVLIFPDNLGWGEVGVYGGVRGVPTPRIDRLAAEGMRLNNFNVEFSCTVSRAALLTGRYAVRTGAVQNSGITQWEVTIAEALKSQGYKCISPPWRIRTLRGRAARATLAMRWPMWITTRALCSMRSSD